jgi:hypothetical protein
MTQIKTLTAIAVLSAAIASPVLAHDASVLSPGSYGLTTEQRATHHHHRADRSFNQWNHSDPTFQRNEDNYGLRAPDQAPWMLQSPI